MKQQGHPLSFYELSQFQDTASGTYTQHTQQLSSQYLAGQVQHRSLPLHPPLPHRSDLPAFLHAQPVYHDDNAVSFHAPAHTSTFSHNHHHHAAHMVPQPSTDSLQSSSLSLTQWFGQSQLTQFDSFTQVELQPPSQPQPLSYQDRDHSVCLAATTDSVPHPQKMIERMEELVLKRLKQLTILRPSAALQHHQPGNVVDPQKPQANGPSIINGLHGEAAVLSQLYNNIQRGTVCTQRDLYYRLVRQFPSQQEVNNHIQRLARALHVSRNDLYVVAGSRGFIGGDLTFNGCNLRTSATGCAVGGRIATLEPSSTMAATSNSTSTTYAPIVDSKAHYIILVEKEAVYYRLLQEGIHTRLPCILLTGRGFPDVATRALAEYIATVLPPVGGSGERPTILGLTDFNPAGVHILIQFLRGHDKGLPSLKWLGLHCKDFEKNSAAVTPFTSRDRTLALNLRTKLSALQKEHRTCDQQSDSQKDSDKEQSAKNRSRNKQKKSQMTTPHPWLLQVDAMIEGHIKAELEALHTTTTNVERASRGGSGLSSAIITKILRKEYI